MIVGGSGTSELRDDHSSCSNLQRKASRLLADPAWTNLPGSQEEAHHADPAETQALGVESVQTNTRADGTQAPRGHAGEGTGVCLSLSCRNQPTAQLPTLSAPLPTDPPPRLRQPCVLCMPCGATTTQPQQPVTGPPQANPFKAGPSERRVPTLSGSKALPTMALDSSLNRTVH